MQPLFLFRMIALSALCAGGAATARPLEIAIAQGRIAGVESGPVQSFHAIPYAVAPVGTLRWAPPQPGLPWPGVRAASRLGHACPQSGAPGGIGGVVPSLDEDCLTLNIWRPRGAKLGDSLPVIVWFHGGGMRTGTASVYDGSWLATRGQPSVVVTVN
jgi:para-nitrobenzyl esterase